MSSLFLHVEIYLDFCGKCHIKSDKIFVATQSAKQKWQQFRWFLRRVFPQLMQQGSVMGWQESVKVHRKDQSVKDFTSKCLFLLFWLISCVSLIFLVEIWSFCTNLLGNYPSHKIDQFPLLRILSLCMDHSMQTRIISLYLFLLFLFMPLALSGQNDVRIHALV